MIMNISRGNLLDENMISYEKSDLVDLTDINTFDLMNINTF